MLHPSYTDLMEVVNSEVEPGEEPVVNSRYSIVMATAKRARQLVSSGRDLKNEKPLSIAVKELHEGTVRVLGEEIETEDNSEF